MSQAAEVTRRIRTQSPGYTDSVSPAHQLSGRTGLRYFRRDKPPAPPTTRHGQTLREFVSTEARLFQTSGLPNSQSTRSRSNDPWCATRLPVNQTLSVRKHRPTDLPEPRGLAVGEWVPERAPAGMDPLIGRVWERSTLQRDRPSPLPKVGIRRNRPVRRRDVPAGWRSRPRWQGRGRSPGGCGPAGIGFRSAHFAAIGGDPVVEPSYQGTQAEEDGRAGEGTLVVGVAPRSLTPTGDVSRATSHPGASGRPAAPSSGGVGRFAFEKQLLQLRLSVRSRLCELQTARQRAALHASDALRSTGEWSGRPCAQVGRGRPSGRAHDSPSGRAAQTASGLIDNGSS